MRTSAVAALNDPCSLPKNNKKQSLNERAHVDYASLCGRGGVIHDADAIYINSLSMELSSRSTDTSQLVDANMKCTA